jgi:hypothetical protein
MRASERFLVASSPKHRCKPVGYRDGDRIVRGYDASVLVVVCNIWLSARQAGALQTQQLPKALWAGSLVRSRLTPSGGITSTTRDEAGGMSQAKR